MARSMPARFAAFCEVLLAHSACSGFGPSVNKNADDAGSTDLMPDTV